MKLQKFFLAVMLLAGMAAGAVQAESTMPVPKCPAYNYNTIDCGRGAILKLGPSANGCLGKPFCAKASVESCPIYNIKICDNNEVLVPGPKLETGCEGEPVCKPSGINCPMVKQPTCPKGTVAMVGESRKGCPGVMECSKPDVLKDNCPIYMPPVCPKGETVEGGDILPNGCEGAPKCMRTMCPDGSAPGPNDKCEHKLPGNCPKGQVPGPNDKCIPEPIKICAQAMPPICKDGEMLTSLGMGNDGCSLGFRCEKKVGNCAQMMPPMCDGGTLVSLGNDKNGCQLGYRCDMPVVKCPTGMVAGKDDKCVKVNVSCPLYNTPVCPKGQTVVAGDISPDGCAGAPRCMPTVGQCPAGMVAGKDDKCVVAPKACSQMMPPMCDGGTLVSLGNDKDGCQLGYRCDMPREKCPAGMVSGPNDKCVKVQVSCPLYEMPICKTGETLVPGSKGKDGCDGAPTCMKNPRACPDGQVAGPNDKCVPVKVSCPIYDIPLCKNGENVVAGPADKDGCTGAPRCVKQGFNCPEGQTSGPNDRCVPVACPQYNAPICKNGEKVVAGTKRSDGCDGPPACVVNLQCPVAMMPLCDGGKLVPLGKDKNGCDLGSKCEKMVAACPQYNAPICKNGEKVVAGPKDAKGCDGAPRCVDNGRGCPEGMIPGPNDKCLPVACPQYDAPKCLQSEMLVPGGKRSDGCTGPATCESRRGR